MSPSQLPYITVRLDSELKAAFEAAADKLRLPVSQWLLQAGIEKLTNTGRELPDPPPKEPKK